LSDPAAGELRIACAEQISAGILGPIIKRLSERYPRVQLFVESSPTRSNQLFPQLDNREVDLVMVTRQVSARAQNDIGRAINIETLFNDRIRLAVDKHGPWARRRKIDLAELVNERWIAVPFHEQAGAALANAFRARGLNPPRVTVTTYSVHLRSSLATAAGFIALLPESVLHLNAQNLRELPIDLPMPPWPVIVATLKNRALNPVVDRFLECAREVVKSIADKPSSRAN
jgi:DNA-binding transcriptional LysR family regulator